MQESLATYLENKKIYKFRSKNFYKVSNYKNSFYIKEDIFKKLSSGTQEVNLEKNYKTNNNSKGLIKWDSQRRKILLSESKVRIYFQPFDVE
jgi:hypothetical protein